MSELCMGAVQEKPQIVFQKKDKGGINIINAVPQTHLTQEAVVAICKEYKISCASITFRCDATADQLIDVIEGNRQYIPCLYVLNKIDDITIEELDILSKVPHYVPICAAKVCPELRRGGKGATLVRHSKERQTI